MKKAIFVLLISIVFSQGYSQTCLVQRDSIISGSGAGRFSDYIYDVLNRLTQVTHTDSGSLQVNTSEAVYYDGNGNISKIETYNTVGTPTLQSTLQYTYTGGKISRLDASGTNNQGPWTTSHNVTYNGSEISSVVIDTTSITGNPDGFPGSFIDFVWQNGNISTLSLLLGSDTIEVAITCDNKNNVYKYLLGTDGASSLFQMANANNITLVETVNNETIMGSSVAAGTALLDNDYTYNTNNDVETLIQNPALFDQSSKTTQFTYDCSAGIHTPMKVSNMNLYPSPTDNLISIENGTFKGTVKIFDIAGKEMMRFSLSAERSTLNISSLNPGIYYIEMTDLGKTFKGKVLKN